MNLNFLGGQPQMSGQPGILQSFSLQQSGSNDSQLMQQHIMVKQMQELQNRRQLQQLEAVQRNALNHMPSFSNHSARQQSQPINSNPVQDTSDYPRQSHFTDGGTNWQQPEYPIAVQRHSNGLMVSPEQGQTMHFIRQQSSQSLYEVPVSNTGGGNLFSQNFMDKSESFHFPFPNGSFSGNPYALNAEQFSLQGANTASRSGSEGKISFDHASSQGVENADHPPVGFYPNQQMQILMSDGSGRGLFGSSDVSTEKSPMLPAASQPTSSQATVGLDPSEEKFLFGSDVNIWEAFGEASTAGNGGADLLDELPSMQSGTWSALMQSAVSETCSTDVGMKDEWSGLESQNSRSQSENQPISNDVSINNATLKANNALNSRFPQAFTNQRSSPTESQVLQDGRRWLDSNVHESSQRPPVRHNLEFVPKSGIVRSGNEQINMNEGKSVFVDHCVNSPSGVAEIQVRENGDGRENFNDSHGHNFPNHALASNTRENLWSNASGRQLIPGPPDIASGYACKGVPVAGMFQYHPMGDVDESSPSPSSRHKVHEVRQTLVSPAGSSLSNMEKGRSSGVSGGATLMHGSLSSSIHPGPSVDKSTPFVRSGRTFSPSQHPSQSQNMLELLHKVDHSKDQNVVSDLASTTYYRSSDTPGGGSIGPAHSQSSTSNGFHFQLALPSRGIDLSDLNDQSSLQSFGSPRSRIVPSEQGANRPGHLDGSESKQKGFLSACLSSSSSSLGDPFQNPCTTVEGGQRMDHLQSSIVSSDGHTYHDQQSTDFQSQAVAYQLVVSNLDNNFASQRDRNPSGMRPPMHQMPPSMLAVMAAMRKDNTSGFQSNDASDVNSFSQQKKDELDGPTSANAVNSEGVASGHDLIVEDPQFFGKTACVPQEDSLGKQSMESSPSNSAASQKHADVIHHSLKRSTTQVMKTIDMDTGHQESPSLRGLENSPDASQITVSSEDAKMLSLAPHSGNRTISPQLLHGAAASSDMLSLGHNVSQKYVTGNITRRPQLAGVSPQMAPALFEQYGAFINGHLVPVQSAPRFPMMKNAEQQFSMPPSNMFVQNSVHLENGVTNTNEIGNTSQITNVYSARWQASSLQPFVSSSPTPLSIRPKKRKTATSELIAWHEEIGNCFKKMQNTSSAEVDWAQSANRLAERGGDAIESTENMSPVLKSRKRLVVTTKLMQQIFPPPSASVLSLDGRSNCEAIVYSVARSSLGDACNLICSVKSDSAPDNGNSMTKTSEKILDQYLSKFIEEFTNKAKELENDLSRLDSRASILDFRLDCQDLERFSVINRFARFHSRKQVDRFETSSSSDTNASSPKRCTQKYFTAHPMPSTVPDRVQCLTIN